MRSAGESWEVELDGKRVVFGAGALARLGELAGDLGCRHALVVTDPGVRDSGHAGRAEQELSEAGLAVAVFDGVASNPTTAHVAAGVRAARAAGEIDLLVGFGGGSAMDCAKGINFILTNGGKMEDYRGSGKATRPLLPSIGVPTTAGTGSESQSYALISRSADHTKMACGDRKARFRTVILDPELTVTQSRSTTAVTGIDALSHAVESYVTRTRNPVSQLFAREAWVRLEGSFETVLERPDDLGARGEMLLGSHLAGLAIELSMLGAAHACANPLTAEHRVPHGIAVALMLPHVMRFNAREVGPLYDELRASGSPAGGGRPLFERVEALRRAAGLPEHLREFDVGRDGLTELAEQAAREWTAGHNPRPVTARDLLELYEAAF